MKNLIILLFLCYAANSMAFDMFGLFKPEINPLTLKSYEERMEYLMNTDPGFKAWVKEQEDKKKDMLAHNEKVLKELEDDWEMRRINTPEQYEHKKAELKRQRQHHLITAQQELEKRMLSEWRVVNDKFVNIQEEKDRVERERKEKEGMENVRKFQKENNLPVTKEGEILNISYE